MNIPPIAVQPGQAKGNELVRDEFAARLNTAVENSVASNLRTDTNIGIQEFLASTDLDTSFQNKPYITSGQMADQQRIELRRAGDKLGVATEDISVINRSRSVDFEAAASKAADETKSGSRTGDAPLSPQTAAQLEAQQSAAASISALDPQLLSQATMTMPVGFKDTLSAVREAAAGSIRASSAAAESIAISTEAGAEEKTSEEKERELKNEAIRKALLTLAVADLGKQVDEQAS